MNREFYVPCAPYAYPINNKNDKDGKSLHERMSKFLSRKRCPDAAAAKQKPEEEVSSISSSKTTDTKSSISESSRSDYNSKRVSANSFKLPKFGSQLKKLFKLKNQREIKTEEEVIIVPNSNENHLDLHDDDDVVESIPVIENLIGLRESVLKIDETSENELLETAESDESNVDNAKDESISKTGVQGSDSENGTAVTTTTTLMTENPPAVLVAATALTAQQFGTQAEVEIQVSRRIARDTARIMLHPPFVYLQQDEPRVGINSQNIFGNERSDSVVSGSESSSVAEVANANEQSEGLDDADQYYNAVLRSVIRKQFRHLDDEPPIY